VRKLRVGVLASHEGTTLQALIDACARDDLNAEIALVISNNSDSGALRRARDAGIPTAHLSGSTHPEPGTLDLAIRDCLQEHEIDLVVLAGYMKKVGPATLDSFKGCIINTHPALLPRFGGQGMYGLNVHRAVLDAREEVSGASVFIVDENYDAGPVVAQTQVPVMVDDTPESLAERVKAAERTLLVAVVNRAADGENLSDEQPIVL
jgi:phosphoribosylglycinamide formyltransferase-1